MIYVSPLIDSAENTDLINSNGRQDLKNPIAYSSHILFTKKKLCSANGLKADFHIRWKSQQLYLSIVLCPAGEDKREVS